MHFHRYFGGPGHLTVSPGRLVLSDRRARRTVVHASSVVRIERKRWEPPTGNHWIEITDGRVTGHATASRGRTERVVAVLVAAGFEVERV